jgi:hypothetical protein
MFHAVSTTCSWYNDNVITSCCQLATDLLTYSISFLFPPGGEKAVGASEGMKIMDVSIKLCSNKS